MEAAAIAIDELSSIRLKSASNDLSPRAHAQCRPLFEWKKTVTSFSCFAFFSGP
jgi:hypothetical protein